MQTERIRLLPCPKCGGVPLMLVMRHCLEADVRIECSCCKLSGPAVAFASRRAQKELLPDLETARIQAADDWNMRT